MISKVNHKDDVESILKIAPTPFFSDRGCHVRILEETRALMELGLQVTICTYHIGQNVDGIQVKRSVRVPWYKKLSAGPSVHKFYLDLLLLWTVIRTCLAKKPDVIHAHLHEGVVVGKIASILFRVPLVADLQGSLTGELLQHKFMKKGGFFHKVFQRAENAINSLPDVILTSSAGVFNSENGSSKTSCVVKVVGDGVDTIRFHQNYSAEDLRDELRIPDGTKVVGYLGVLTEYQGVSTLLESIPIVLEENREMHFLIMGYPNVEYYQEKAK